MANELTRASFKKKEVDSIPKDAKILSEDKSISVEEIENGYLTSVSVEVKYQYDGRTDYSYHTKKYFSKDNPLQIDTEKFNFESFVDDFE